MKTGTPMNKAIPRTKKEKSDRKKFNKKRRQRLKESIKKLNEQTKEKSKPVTKIRKVIEERNGENL